MMAILKKHPRITVLGRKNMANGIDIPGYPEDRIDVIDYTEELGDISRLKSDYLYFNAGGQEYGKIKDLLSCLLEEDKAVAAYIGHSKGNSDKTSSPFLDKKALLIDREVFIISGGFDKDIDANDIDLGLRLWVMGYKTYSLGQTGIDKAGQKTVSLYDKLKIAYKNFSYDLLGGLLWLCLDKNDEKRSIGLEIDPADYDLKGLDVEGSRVRQIEDLSPGYLSYLADVKNYLGNIKYLKGKREKIQSSRKRLDKSIFRFFKDDIISFFRSDEASPEDRSGIEGQIEKSMEIKILVISNEIVAKSMAGPGIRAYNISKELSKHFDVTLLCPNRPDLTDGFDILKTDENLLRKYVEVSDIIITSGTTVAKYKFLKDCNKIMIFDLYDPYNIASLVEYGNQAFSERMEASKKISGIINFQIKRADYLLCASSRQKDLWMGMANALGRFEKPAKEPERLIGVVPFGLDENPPEAKDRELKGVVDGIAEDDFVILWGGGIYNWFDPLVLIKAMALLKDDYPDIKLYFMGVKHPNPEVKELKMAGDTFDMAKNMGLLDNNVFFNFGWVDYEKRAGYLLDSDVGIITYPDHIETRFAFRTRILDYFWAGLPVIASKGDYLSNIVERESLGLTVSDSPREIADAILNLYDNKGFYCECKANITRIRENFRWSNVIRPLIDYCKDPDL